MDVRTLSRAVVIPIPRAQRWAAALADAMSRYGIDTPDRMATFLAHVAQHSRGLLRTCERWVPTGAQLAYEGSEALGNCLRGDGYRYRARGLMPIRGRANYAMVSVGLGVNALAWPALLQTEVYAALSAAWWWHAHGCNRLCDEEDWAGIAVCMGADVGEWGERMRRWHRARWVLGLR